MSRIKRKPKRFHLEDVIRVNTGKALRLVDKILERHFIERFERKGMLHIKGAKDRFLSRHPEFSNYIWDDEIVKINCGDLMVLHFPDLETEKEFLDAFYTKEDEFRGIESVPVDISSPDSLGVLYPVQLMSDKLGYAGGLPLSPIVIREKREDVLLHELTHALSREATLEIYNDRNLLYYCMNFSRRYINADEIIAYFSHKVFIKNDRKLDIFKSLKKESKLRVKFKRVIRNTMWSLNHCLSDNIYNQKTYLTHHKILDNMIFKVRHKYRYSRKSFK